VVIIDVSVAPGRDLQIEQAMAGELVEHVVEEGDAGVHLAATGAIEIQGHVNIGFAGDAMDLAGTRGADGHAGVGNGPKPNHAKASADAPWRPEASMV
jgi:NaMN:DMB phosphoribosyltransferase